MMRLINGNVNTLALARNARTSQAMIDKFYAAHLTTNQVRQQLHGFTEKTTTEKKSAKKSVGTASKSIRLSSKTVQNSTIREDTK
jgi:ribonuclease HIII